MSEHTLNWQDGDLPVSALYDDTFYSRHNGRAETEYVFLGGNGLPERWNGVEHFHIGELGFGTGLNLLETWHHWCAHRQPGQHLMFTSFEAHPLTVDAAARALSAWPQLADQTERLLDIWPTLFENRSPQPLDAQTSIQIIKGDALAGVTHWQGRAHAWFLDGFSPAKNPDMWSDELMTAVSHHTHARGTFATYTAAGWVRRNLEAAGFTVEKRQGYGTKRDMLAGTKQPG